MKKISTIFVFLLVFFCSGFYLGYSQVTQALPIVQTKTVDVNKDGKPDVTYYHDGKNVTKVEADTNFDGKPDVTVYAENGKFKSAEADTDYDGKPDKKFTDVNDFNKWVNKDNPKFKESLGWSDWSDPIFKF